MESQAMPISQLLPDIYVPTFEIVVNGLPLSPLFARKIIQVSVTESLEPPNQFSFQLHAPTLELINIQDGALTEGSRVDLHIGYVGNTQKMITGEIAALTADFSSDGPATLQVDGFDLLHRLTRGTFYRTFEELPDSEIVSRIASEMDLTPSVALTPRRTESRVQYYTTNLHFLTELAQANGYFLWVEDENLHFKPERPAPNTIQLEWGKTLTSFSTRLSTAGQVNVVEVRWWDPKQKQSFSVRVERSSAATATLAPTGQQQIARGAGGRSEKVITDAPVTSAKQALAYAEAALSGQEQTVITGHGTSVGHPGIRVGTMLELSGLGRFDRSYIVTEVTHTVSESGYQTSFQVNSALHLSSVFSSADDLFTATDGHDRRRTYGVLVGTVISNKDFQGWVKVKLPGLSDDEIGHQARLAAGMAGAERGMFFLPEVGDEVLVAFEQGDITRPYVLGALWNGKDKPPETNGDGKNNLRFIRSRSGHQVRLDDTDGAEKIAIIDKSGTNHITIDTSSNTISITSMEHDINVEAKKGTIRLAAQNIEMTSTAETKVAAKGGLTLDGSPGNTTIKGAIVNIN
jgi:phage protein D